MFRQFLVPGKVLECSQGVPCRSPGAPGVPEGVLGGGLGSPRGVRGRSVGSLGGPWAVPGGPWEGLWGGLKDIDI